MLNITVVQPAYYAGEQPDEKIAEFLLEQFNNVTEGGLIVLPEYSNAGGLSDVGSELKTLPRAEKASEVAKNKKAYVARASFSMNDDEHDGCSMIVAPDGQIINDIGKGVGSISAEVDPFRKYMRTAGFGSNTVRNEENDEKAEYDLNTKQIALLKKLIEGNSYTRRISSTIIGALPDKRYTIFANWDDNGQKYLHISLLGGEYIQILGEYGSHYHKIKNPDFENELMSILDAK